MLLLPLLLMIYEMNVLSFLFPQDELFLLSMGDEGLFYYLTKDSLRVSHLTSNFYLLVFIKV